MRVPNEFAFAGLTPDLAMNAVEDWLGAYLDGALTPFNSYVNRVFGFSDEDGNRFIAKFYRPGRWTRAAILAEHAFLADCAGAEVPVVPPLPNDEGQTLGNLDGIPFAVFPRVAGRTFEPETDEDWLRLGRVIGRLHAVGAQRPAPDRPILSVSGTAAKSVADILGRSLVHPECEDEFTDVCGEGLAVISPLLDAVLPDARIRIHGDCHRGNLLRAGGSDGEAVTVIDFDDMVTGPAIQDLWILLPDRVSGARKELNLILEGYGEFRAFDRAEIRLVEPLRFLRHLYFLAWQAVQRDDPGFAGRYPDWGTKAFWETETEDLSTQLGWIKAELRGGQD